MADGARDCAICLEPLASPERALPCAHVFHDGCIGRWLAQHEECPMCRAAPPPPPAPRARCNAGGALAWLLALIVVLVVFEYIVAYYRDAAASPAARG